VAKFAVVLSVQILSVHSPT